MVFDLFKKYEKVSELTFLKKENGGINVVLSAQNGKVYIGDSFYLGNYIIDQKDIETFITEELKAEQLNFGYEEHYDEAGSLTGKTSNFFINHDKEFVTYYSVDKENKGKYIYFSWPRHHESIWKSKKLVIDFYNRYQQVEGESLYTISYLIKTQQGFNKITKTRKAPEIKDMSLYYNGLDHDAVIKEIETEGSGIILFDSEPGCGKSSYLRHLASISGKDFVYIDTNNAGMLTDPSFITYASEELRGDVLIIEDAENLMRDRSSNANGSIVGTLLNMSDGFMGDLLECKIILTLNKTEFIDDALLRPGRLKIRQKFDLLPVEKANKLSELLGLEDRYTSEVTLAQVFNGNVKGAKEKQQKIGF